MATLAVATGHGQMRGAVVPAADAARQQLMVPPLQVLQAQAAVQVWTPSPQRPQSTESPGAHTP
jgi:hypothetical protein